MELRPYQEAAVAAVYDHLRSKDNNPVVCIPTGGGKTAVMAKISSDAVRLWGGRVLILAHVKELLEQSYKTLERTFSEIVDTKSPIDIGLYSAGLNSRDTEHDVVVAGIQSVYQRAADFGHRDLILVDECHLIPTDGDGMYQRFLSGMRAINSDLRVLGFTATPFRLDAGPICSPDHFLNEICHQTTVRELIGQGYLCRLSSKATEHGIDTSQLSVRGGEFIQEQMEAAYLAGDNATLAIEEMMRRCVGCKSVLIFASGVDHAHRICDLIDSLYGYSVAVITGDTDASDRKATIEKFRSGELAFLVNVNVLTTGFDAPNVDCVALMRATCSPGLYYQMVGRGFRIFPGKQRCLVLDFGGNIKRHGPVDMLRIKLPGDRSGPAPVKKCPECDELVPASVSICTECGFEFPARKSKVDEKAEGAGVVSDEYHESTIEVKHVEYRVHEKKGGGPTTPKTMRVDYFQGFHGKASEWICFEHEGFARRKAVAWWSARSDYAVPETAWEAVELAKSGALAPTTEIVVRYKASDKFPSIVKATIGEKPAVKEIMPTFSEDDVPF